MHGHLIPMHCHCILTGLNAFCEPRLLPKGTTTEYTAYYKLLEPAVKKVCTSSLARDAPTEPCARRNSRHSQTLR